MKKSSFVTMLIMLVCSVMQTAIAQPPRTQPREIPAAIPKHEIARPQVSAKLVKLGFFHQYISSITWRGARIWHPPGYITVDSVLSVQFNTDGTVTWNKQGWEFVSRKAGTYKVTGNKVVVDFAYAPYTHHLEGMYDASTGKITGTFTEQRAVDPNAPSAYSPGTTTGEFNFYKK